MPKKFQNDEERREYERNLKRQRKAKKIELESTKVETTEQKTPKYQFDSMEEMIQFFKAKMLEDSSIKQQLLEDDDNEQYIIESVEIPKEDKEAIFKILEQRCLKYGFNFNEDFDIKKFIHTDKKKEYFSSHYIRYKNGYGYYTEGVQFTTDINAIISQYKIFPKYKNLIQKWLE
jgi:hypothetical protein